MRFIMYKELNKGKGDYLLTKSLVDKPYPNQDRIAHFLRYNGTYECSRMSYMRDYFTGKFIPREVHLRSSDDYFWSTILAYYVEKYNLRLPKEFEDYILTQIKD